MGLLRKGRLEGDQQVDGQLRRALRTVLADRRGVRPPFNFDTDTLTPHIPKGNDQDAPLPPNFATAFPNVKVSRGEVGKYLIPWDKTSVGPRLGRCL